MMKRLHELSAVLTCFGYRRPYQTEMEGMLATARAHHPGWPVVAGRGPVAGCERPTLEVESPAGTCQWSLPVPLHLDGSENDFYKIVMIKGWWMAQVWRQFGGLAGPGCNRLVWLDADTRLNGRLDIELDPEAEVVAGPWWHEPEYFDGKGMIGSGLLAFQGARDGAVGRVLDQWSAACLKHINLPRHAAPSGECDDDLLTELLHSAGADAGYTLLKLEKRKYSGWLPAKDGKLLQRSLVDHWYISEKMESPETGGRDWPPPEEYRRGARVGSRLPGWAPDWGPTGESPDEA